MCCEPTIRTTPRTLVAVPCAAGKHPIPGRSDLSAEPGGIPPTPQCSARMEADPCRSRSGWDWFGCVSHQVQSPGGIAGDLNPRHADRAWRGRLSADWFQLRRATRVYGLGLPRCGGRARGPICDAEPIQLASEPKRAARMRDSFPQAASRLHPRTRYLLAP